MALPERNPRLVMNPMPEKLLILTTGGTIDKVYFDAKSTYCIGDPQVAEVLRSAEVDLSWELVSLMRKDSLEITTAERENIRERILSSTQDRILITHGTDTMTDTALHLQDIPGKTIVLTGSLQPARFRDNDAIFNIGFALAAVQILAPGVYIAMNGRIHDPRKVRKDRSINRFVQI